MNVQVSRQETKPAPTVEQLEKYLRAKKWQCHNCNVWYKEHKHNIFADNIQHALNTLSIDEGRTSGEIYDEIIAL